MATASLESFANFVVVGGGIAGVSCAEQLSALNPTSSIILLTASKMVKAVTNFKKVSRALETFEVEETSSSHLTASCPNVTVIQGTAHSVQPLDKVVTVSTNDNTSNRAIHYDRLCICTGAVPNLVIRDHPYVIGIRDTESVKDLQEKVKHSRRVIVLGNGGIAIELVYEISHCQVIWAIKDSHIGNTFFDEGAAKFFLPNINNPTCDKSATTGDKEREDENKDGDVVTSNGGDIDENGVLVKTKPLKRMKYMLDPLDSANNSDTKGPVTDGDTARHIGSALGPDWSEDLKISGKIDRNVQQSVHVEYNSEVTEMLTPDEMSSKNLHETHEFKVKQGNEDCSWPLFVKLNTGKIIGCDLVVSATGVVPNSQEFTNDDQIKLSGSDGGIVVDNQMCTGCTEIYAAGDVCSVHWPDVSRLWFQMRLWSQARQMGAYAAKCMTAHTVGESMSLDFCFELFAHVTKFFGYKVVLLGRYNAQGLNNDYELLLRITEGVEYIKVILQNGRMVGAILIGDTDLEETFENLILNQMDLSNYRDSLLDPNIDIEDYFD